MAHTFGVPHTTPTTPSGPPSWGGVWSRVGSSILSGLTGGISSGIGGLGSALITKGNPQAQFLAGGAAQTGVAQAQNALQSEWQSSQAASQGQRSIDSSNFQYNAQSFQGRENALQRSHERQMLATELSANGQSQGQVPWYAMPPEIQERTRQYQNFNPYGMQPPVYTPNR